MRYLVRFCRLSPGKALGLGVVAFLAAALARAETPQIDWVGDWDKAFALAKETKRPVMICINSKDGEKANEATAKEIYHDAEFVELSKSFVMVPISTRTHNTGGVCPRFGVVTCQQHLDCWKALAAAHGDQFVTAFAQGEMITPQHAWFSPEGKLLARKEFWMDKAELVQRMRRALEPEAEVKGPGEAEGPPGLTDGERSDLAKAEGKDAEARRTAIGNLLATEKPVVRAAVIDLLNRATDPDVKCEAMRCLGRAQVMDARVPIEEHLEHKDATVRSFAAVALERLAQKESVPPLLKRAKSERDQTARKNVCRALGMCGGPAADEDAAATLLKAVSGDKQNMIRKHAALALRWYSGEAASALVRGKLEQLAGKTKDRSVRGGIVYALAYIGKRETTEPIFKEILEDQHDEYGKNFMREALRLLRGEGDFGRSAWFLFWEDRDDPARSDDIPKDIPGGGGGGR